MSTERLAWGQTLFCDDIRHEVSNKLSIIGIYQSDFIVNTDFPLIVPKFCLYVSYYELAGRLNEELQLRIYFPGGGDNPGFQANIPRPAPSEQMPAVERADSDRVNIIRAPIMFSPLQIAEPGDVKVRMHCGDVVTKLGLISIRKATEAEMGLFLSAQLQQPAPPQSNPPT